MIRFAALVLAAGTASRYRAAGGAKPSKLVDLFAGEPLVCHAVRAALGSRATPVIVVTGHAAAAVDAALAGRAVRVVHNPAYAEGLASSLRAGLAAVPPEVDGAVVMLGDMPLVTAATVDALAAAADETADAVVPVVAGERGNPVLLARRLFQPASRLGGDEGARRLLRQPGLRVIEVPVSGETVRLDVDEPAAFRP